MDKDIDKDDKKMIQEQLEQDRKEKIKNNQGLDKKKDLVQDFSMNFYDKLIDKDKKHRKHDDKLTQLTQDEANK